MKFHGVELKLGDPDEPARAPVEHYDDYVNGKHVGDVYAGFENGRVVEDPAKYSKEKDFTVFRESGFKDQIKKLESEIRDKLEK